MEQMTLQEIINLITSQGIGIACVAYLIYFQNTTMKAMTETLEQINIKLTQIETKIDVVENGYTEGND